MVTKILKTSFLFEEKGRLVCAFYHLQRYCNQRFKTTPRSEARLQEWGGTSSVLQMQWSSLYKALLPTL